MRVLSLHHDTQVTGVVELAFFRALMPPDLALTKLVADVIGTALRGLVSRTSDCLARPIDMNRLFSLLRLWLPALERLWPQPRSARQAQGFAAAHGA